MRDPRVLYVELVIRFRLSWDWANKIRQTHPHKKYSYCFVWMSRTIHVIHEVSPNKVRKLLGFWRIVCGGCLLGECQEGRAVR